MWVIRKKYESDLIAILSRFSVKGKYVAEGDESRLITIVSELDDLFTDCLGKNKYSSSIVNAFNSGTKNYYGSPSYNCVETIIPFVSSAITRIERNPEILNKKENKERKIKPLEYPEKMTLNWIKEHIPVSYMWSFVLLLFFVFSLGVTFANTNLYKSLTEMATVKINTNVKKAKNNEQRNTSKTPIILTPKT